MPSNTEGLSRERVGRQKENDIGRVGLEAHQHEPKCMSFFSCLPKCMTCSFGRFVQTAWLTKSVDTVVYSTIKGLNNTSLFTMKNLRVNVASYGHSLRK